MSPLESYHKKGVNQKVQILGAFCWQRLCEDSQKLRVKKQSISWSWCVAHKNCNAFQQSSAIHRFKNELNRRVTDNQPFSGSLKVARPVSCIWQWMTIMTMSWRRSLIMRDGVHTAAACRQDIFAVHQEPTRFFAINDALHQIAQLCLATRQQHSLSRCT